MALLSPNDKLQSGKKYVFEFSIASNFGTSCFDAELARRLNLAFAHVENAQVTRPFFSERVTITFTWRGPMNSVSIGANTIALVLASCGTLTFLQASSGTLAEKQREEQRETGDECAGKGFIEGFICGIEKRIGSAVNIVIALVLVLVAAVVAIAFSPAGREGARRI